MKMKTQEMDMLHGPLVGKLLRFTLPVALSSIVQQLFNAADTAVVGSFGSVDALAAVGTNTEIVALVDSLCRSVHRRERPALRPDRTRGNGKNT